MGVLHFTGFGVYYVTGIPGAGKSFFLVRQVVDERLTDSDCKIVTNLPLNVEAIAEYVSQRRGCNPEDVAARIVLLDTETLVRWKRGEGGPWELVERLGDGEEKMRGWELILDEVHNYCGSEGMKRTHIKRWQDWIGEVRHEKYERVVFVSQDESKVAKCIPKHSEIHVDLTKRATLRDPWLRVPMEHWYQMRASLTGRYIEKTVATEYRKSRGRFIANHAEIFAIDSKYFPFYNTHSASGGLAEGGGQAGPVKEWQLRKFWRYHKAEDGKRRAPMVLWFMGQHWFYSGVALLCVGIILFCLSGYGGWLVGLIPKFLAWFGAKSAPESSSALAEYQRNKNHTVAVSTAKGVARGPSPIVRPPSTLAPLPADPSERADELQRRLDIVSEALGSMAKEHQQLIRKTEEAYSLALLTPTLVVFRGGESYGVGERILNGPFRGASVQWIDFRHRTARLSNGHLLRLAFDDDGLRNVPGAGGGASGAAGSAHGAGVSVAVPRSEGERSAAGLQGSAAAIADAVHSGDAAAAVPGVRGRSNGGVGGGGGSPGPAAGFNRGSQPAGGGGAWSRGSTAGGSNQ